MLLYMEIQIPFDLLLAVGFLFPRPNCSFVLGSRTSSVVLSWAKGKILGLLFSFNVIKNIVSGFLRTVPGEEARTKMQEGLLQSSQF